MKNLREVENLNFAYTDMSLNQTYQTSFKHALQMIKRNGGSISGDNITIVCQTPVPVRFEQAFEGMFPIGRQEIRKELRHLGSFIRLFHSATVAAKGQVSFSRATSGELKTMLLK